MDVQIFGVNNNNDVRKAQRFFKERRANVHFMDFKQRSPSKGELRRFFQKFGEEQLIDRDAKRFTKKYDGTPLLIHSTTNDEDVNVLEVERLIQALKANGKQGFEYKIYDKAPGGHAFNRLDTRIARESRREIWKFLAPHLRPERPVK